MIKASLQQNLEPITEDPKELENAKKLELLSKQTGLSVETLGQIKAIESSVKESKKI